MRKRLIILPSIISNILTLKRDGDIIKLLAKKNIFLTSQLSIRKTATTFNKIAMNVVLKDRKIAHLQEELA